ncbi:MAG: hypothetical protein KAV18_06260 [Candidatus Omnitrophica bacterium]|nr:hypothetical protein [Candidatus Omnitrophota bacterium]
MLTITINNESFELSDAEVKAAEWDMISIKDYIENAIKNKARQCIDQIVTDHTDKQPKKISIAEKESIVLAAPVKSAKQRQAELEAEILKKCLAKVE